MDWPAQIVLSASFEAIETLTGIVGLTVMVYEQLLLQPFPSVYVYTIVCVPTPAVAGLKFPPLTPLPVYVPPEGFPPANAYGAVFKHVDEFAGQVTMGNELLESTTSSVKIQAPLVIVQRKVALVPAAIPVTVLVADVGVVIVAVPLTMLQIPLPIVGVLPAKVNELLLQLF